MDGYISTRKLSIKEKKYNLWEKPFQKENFCYDVEIKTYICPPGRNIISKKNIRIQRQQRITYWTNECKNRIMKEICCKKRTTEQSTTMETLPKSECNGKWKQTWHKKSTKNNQKQHNYHLHT